MLIESLAVFIFDFLTEVCSVFWVLSVNRKNKARAVLYTCISVALTRGALYLIIQNEALLIPSGFGEICGTLVAMILDERRKDWRKIQKRARGWFMHTVLKRPLPRKERKKKIEEPKT